LIDRDAAHRALYKVFLNVRDAAAKILESTTIADIADPAPLPRHKRRQKKTQASVLPMVVHGNSNRTDR